MLFVVLASTFFGFVVEGLWNWLMPTLFRWHLITFWQGLGLFVLSKILFGGFHRHGFHRGPWKERMKARWESMTPEEREKAPVRGCGTDAGAPRRPGRKPQGLSVSQLP